MLSNKYKKQTLKTRKSDNFLPFVDDDALLWHPPPPHLPEMSQVELNRS